MKFWFSIIFGTLLVSLALFGPGFSRDARAAGGMLGGVLMVIGLAPGRQQNLDPKHRVYQGKSGKM